MIKISRQKEDQLLGQIQAMIGYLEAKRERVERSDAGPVEVAELTLKIDEAWKVFERRGVRRG